MNNAIQITMDTSEYPIRSVGEISILPKAIPIFTDSRPRKKYRRRNLVARTNEASQKHSADAFVDKNDIDDIIYSLLIGSSTKNKRMFTKAAAFTAGINTGYRAGDVLSLRVEDVVDEDDIEMIQISANEASEELDENSWMLSDQNYPSYLAIVGVAFRKDEEDKLKEWLPIYISNNQFIRNQQKAFLHMKESFEAYLKKGMVA